MPKTLALTRSDEGQYPFKESAFVCDGCGENFSKPILATVSSGGILQKYYACPHCLTEVSNAESQGSEDGKTSVLLEGVENAAAKLESNMECKNFFGYLKKRPKSTPIPDECLTCDKTIECLIR